VGERLCGSWSGCLRGSWRGCVCGSWSGHAVRPALRLAGIARVWCSRPCLSLLAPALGRVSAWLLEPQSWVDLRCERGESSVSGWSFGASAEAACVESMVRAPCFAAAVVPVRAVLRGVECQQRRLSVWRLPGQLRLFGSPGGGGGATAAGRRGCWVRAARLSRPRLFRCVTGRVPSIGGPSSASRNSLHLVHLHQDSKHGGSGSSWRRPVPVDGSQCCDTKWRFRSMRLPCGPEGLKST